MVGILLIELHKYHKSHKRLQIRELKLTKIHALHLAQRRLHTTMVDPQSEFLRSCQLALGIKVTMKLCITQGGLERLYLLSIRPAKGLLDSGQGPAHLNTSEKCASATIMTRICTV